MRGGPGDDGSVARAGSGCEAAAHRRRVCTRRRRQEPNLLVRWVVCAFTVVNPTRKDAESRRGKARLVRVLDDPAPVRTVTCGVDADDGTTDRHRPQARERARGEDVSEPLSLRRRAAGGLRLPVGVVMRRERSQRRWERSLARAGDEVLVRSVAVRVGGRGDTRHESHSQKRQHPHEDQFPHISLLGTVHGRANPLTSLIRQSSNGFPPYLNGFPGPTGRRAPGA